jgi:eukaryotic-like serine/threonine-protein kinase
MGFSPGMRLGPYEVLSLIGSGGMGDVYRGRDPRLGRDVAIKVITARLSADPVQRVRFEREARAIGRLVHPHICRLYDIGHQGDIDFLVMEYLEGETLADYLRHHPQPAVDDAVGIARDIADAMEEAHKNGLVHRDLKPANVMITAGGVKLLDFGLAKLMQEPAAGADSVTATVVTAGATIVGTVPYMAPEQVQGHHLDSRTDVFALGAILYQMLTGRPPFEGVTDVSMMAAIITQDPVPVRRIRPDVPVSIVRIVEQCLEKDPHKRLQSFAAVCAALTESITPKTRQRTRVRPSAATPDRVAKHLIRTIAVLPLRNAAAPDDDHLAAGVTEALIDALAEVGGLKVISRTSTQHFLDREADLSDVARKLGIDGWIEGTVAHVEGRIQVTIRLIQARTQEHLWAASYDRKLTDVFGVQGEIAEAVASGIQLKLRSPERRRLVKRSTDPQAQEAYLLARFHRMSGNAEGLRLSLRYFEAAIARDPDYSLAHAGLADWYVTATLARIVSPTEATQKAKNAAIMALQLDSMLPEAHCCLGILSLYELDWRRARAELETALHLNPNLADAHIRLALLLSSTGQTMLAAEHAALAQQLDPLSPRIHVNAAVVHYVARQYDRAIHESERAIELAPEFANALYVIGLCRYFLGEVDRAVSLLERARSAAPEHASPAVGLAYVWARTGRRDEALGVLADLKERATRAEVSPYDFAELYAGLGDHQLALDYLKRSHDLKLPELLGMASDPLFDPIRHEPRFHALMTALGLNTPPAVSSRSEQKSL